MPTVTVNAVSLYYEESGTGPPLVLVHGFDGRCSSASLVDKLVPAT
jgi:pimeloyl-ACP methyl ester carboxylesterase